MEGVGYAVRTNIHVLRSVPLLSHNPCVMTLMAWTNAPAAVLPFDGLNFPSRVEGCFLWCCRFCWRFKFNHAHAPRDNRCFPLGSAFLRYMTSKKHRLHMHRCRRCSRHWPSSEGGEAKRMAAQRETMVNVVENKRKSVAPRVCLWMVIVNRKFCLFGAYGGILTICCDGRGFVRGEEIGHIIDPVRS